MYCLLALACLFVSARSYACLYIWILESSDLRLRPLLIQGSLQMQGPTCPSHTRLASQASGQLTASLFGLRVSDSLSSPASPLLWLCTRDCPNKTSRLHCCDQGRAVGCSACGPMPVWGLTHGHAPGVSLWAGVAGLLRGRWLPAFFWCLLFVSFSRSWGGTTSSSTSYPPHRPPVGLMVMRDRHHTL